MWRGYEHHGKRLTLFNAPSNRATMAEIRTGTMLRRKRDEIRRSIKLYEKRLEQARATPS